MLFLVFQGRSPGYEPILRPSFGVLLNTLFASLAVIFLYSFFHLMHGTFVFQNHQLEILVVLGNCE